MREKLLEQLRRIAPSKVRAVCGDDVREIAVPERRKRWSQVIDAIEAAPWHRVELLNKRGEVLGYVDNTSPGRDLEDISPVTAGRARSEVQWMVELIVRAQREALSYRDSEVKELLQAQALVVRELAAGVRDLGGLYREQVRAVAETAQLQAAPSGDGDGDLDALLKAAPELLRALPLLQSLLAGAGKKS